MTDNPDVSERFKESVPITRSATSSPTISGPGQDVSPIKPLSRLSSTANSPSGHSPPRKKPAPSTTSSLILAFSSGPIRELDDAISQSSHISSSTAGNTTLGPNALGLQPELVPLPQDSTPKPTSTPPPDSQESLLLACAVSEPPSTFEPTASRAAVTQEHGSSQLVELGHQFRYYHGSYEPNTQKPNTAVNALLWSFIRAGDNAAYLIHNEGTHEEFEKLLKILYDDFVRATRDLSTYAQEHPDTRLAANSVRDTLRSRANIFAQTLAEDEGEEMNALLKQTTNEVIEPMDQDSLSHFPAPEFMAPPDQPSLVGFNHHNPIMAESIYTLLREMKDEMKTFTTRLELIEDRTQNRPYIPARKSAVISLPPVPLEDEPMGTGWGDTVDFDSHASIHAPTHVDAADPTTHTNSLEGFQRFVGGSRSNHNQAKPPPKSNLKPASFADAAKKGADKPPPKSTALKEKIVKAILNDPKHENTCFVFSFPKEEQPELQIPATDIGIILNPILRTHKEGMRLNGAKWNARGNLILTFPYATPLTFILEFLPTVIQKLRLPASTQVRRDLSWSKILLSHVPTGVSSIGGTRYTDEQLESELLEANPWMTNLEITQKPRWITKTDRMHNSRSSITFAFEDPKGNLVRELLAKNIYMFTSEVKAKKWTEKPLLKGCTRCLSLDHYAHGCNRAYRCDICAGNHATNNHCHSCTECKKENNKGNCTHPLKCANCPGAHKSSDSSCPRRDAFRTPIGKTLADARALAENPEAPDAVGEDVEDV